ncbi:hypothetical protein A1A1_13797 [Planococcus antarcticus DSM 14505]|uniref:Uncharacterized protein n=1 Tax=Planococcus antarcticus DSM 14505 TaxID=1185653 RepID=A0AA87IK38_9BACL|nr:hypothetical protein [Planococcus antarcticus]EIM05899.1 hypothetical protein A1A1_13797 [Planococcus antarcticus DSM 14505]
MAWFSTTRWTDRDIVSLDVATKLIMSENESLANDGGVSYSNLEKEKAFEQNQTVTIDNRVFSYNVIEFSMNSITPGSTPIEARTQPIRGLIILYSDGNRVHYIINRNYDALKLLRKLLGYEGRNEILNNNLLFSDDIFMWFVKIVFSKENEFSFTGLNQNELALIINSIIGVRGETRDENRLSAQGDTVLNLISTLSFILESNLLKQIVLRTEYTGHENIEMRLNDKGVVAVETDSYSGNYEDLEDPKMKAQVLLLVYLEVIPKLLQVYFEEKDEEKWSLSEKDIFFNSVEKKLIERLQERKNEFRIEQMTLIPEIEQKEAGRL